MTTKLLTIIDEAPARHMQRKAPFSGSSGDRLARLAGTSIARLRQATVLRNIADRYPGASGKKGDAWPAKEALQRASRARFRMPMVLFAGRQVATAFGLKRHPYLHWLTWRGKLCTIIPHPSGVCRWYNSHSNRSRAESFMALLLARITA